jgi:DNA modification methylase
MSSLFSEFDRVAKPNAVVVFFSQGMYTADLMHGPWKKYWRYNLIWAKNKVRGALNANRQPLRAHEDLVVFYKKQPDYTPQMNIARCMGKGGGNPPKRTSTGSNYGDINSNISKRYKSEDRHPTSVLLFPVVNEKDTLHPTQKPVDIIEFLIKSYTKEYATVLDPTMGSGTTGVACINTNRSFIGIENDADIFNVAKERLSDLKLEDTVESQSGPTV